MDGDAVVHQLEAVSVSRDDDTLRPAGRKGLRQRSDDVVRLKAGGLHHGQPQGGSNLLGVRKLDSKIFGHTLAVCLVLVINCMTKVFAFFVKSNCKVRWFDITKRFK